MKEYDQATEVGAERGQTDVSMALDDLRSATMRLNRVADTVRERLQSVLHASVPQEVASSPRLTSGASTALGSSIREMENSVEDAISIMQDVLDRVEV